jgi:hypothetical protein
VPLGFVGGLLPRAGVRVPVGYPAGPLPRAYPRGARDRIDGPCWGEPSFKRNHGQ